MDQAAESRDDLRTTPLTSWHQAAGARMVPFAGFLMPVQYESVLAEHAAVRERVGLFDITHMGEIAVSGPGAEAWLDGLVTNRVAGIAPGKVVYTPMCRADGVVLDDMLVYRLDAERWYVVCNASNHAKIAGRLTERRPTAGVQVRDVSDATALVAVQGPESRELLRRLSALADVQERIDGLDFYTAFMTVPHGAEWIVSRTGYTGEHGYELYVPGADAPALWEELLERGGDLGVAPVGLAARDTLRFELAYCLYGHELDEQTTPLEAGIAWAVKLKKGDFVGREALAAQKAAGVPRRLVGLEVAGRAIARQGAPVLAAGREVGRVTSGTFSPTLQQSLALALVAADAPVGEIEVEVRGKRLSCTLRSLPFVTARVKGDPRAERTLP
ncbi:MAG: glycine cleavage system aminomethyltransferase GcvT [Candidatus Krumholzibacteriia bacterium]